MAHPYSKEAQSSHSGKVSRMGLHAGGAADEREDKEIAKKVADKEIGKAFSEHDSQLHGGKRTRLKLKDGGAADGESAKPRHDRARGGASGKGGKAKHGAHVNVIVAPQSAPHPPMMGGGLGMAPVRPAGPPAPPPAPPPMMPPPGGAGVPPMMGGGPRPGMPIAPGGVPPRKRGGAVARKQGGGVTDNDSTDEDRAREQMGPYAKRRAGGAIGPFEDKKPSGEGIGEVGSGSGLGRLAKIRVAEKEEGEMKKEARGE